MNLEHKITQWFQEVFKKEYSETIKESEITIQKTRKEFEGDYTINIFPFLKISKESPENTAKKIGISLLKYHKKSILNFQVVKGFLNLTLSKIIWEEWFKENLKNPQFIFSNKKTHKEVMVEFSSPNTNKPLHLGHLRNIFLGYSISKILKANGNKVITTQIVNDRGIHICKSMVAWLHFGNGTTPKSENIKGDKFVGNFYVLFDNEYKKQIKELISKGYTEEKAKQNAPIFLEAKELLIKWENKNEQTIELWKKMNQWVYDGFDVTYKTMNVTFELVNYESITYLLGKGVVNEGLKKQIFYKKEDGSIWCDLTQYGLDKKLLVRADQTAVYITQDIGTAIERFKLYPALKKLIYTVGNEQDYHFKVLFLILKKLKYKWADDCFHLSYGMVELPEGKMKSREGTAVDADDLMQQMIEIAKHELKLRNTAEEFSKEEINQLSKTIGLGALKYFLLKVHPKKKILFNPKKSIDFNGNTAPFIQYTYARIQALLRKQNKIENPNIAVKWHKKEFDIIKYLYDFQKVLIEAENNLNPSLICNYIYELVKMYNSFYQSIRIFDENENQYREFRLSLSFLVGVYIKENFNLLGIQVPHKM